MRSLKILSCAQFQAERFHDLITVGIFQAGSWQSGLIFFQLVFTIPEMLGLFFKCHRKLLGSLCHAALRSFVAKMSPPHFDYQQLLMAAESSAEYFL